MQGAERHCRVGDDVRVRGLPCFRVHAARKIECEDDSSPRNRFDHGRPDTPQAGLAADAGNPIEHQVGRCQSGRSTLIDSVSNPVHLAARRQQRPYAPLMRDIADQERADMGTARTEVTTSQKGVAAVVARADEQDDTATVDTAEARLKSLRTDARQASRRAVHQHPVRAATESETLGLPKIVAGHGAQHLIGVHAFTLS